MIQLWKNHWPLIIPGLILAAWVVNSLIEGESGIPMPRFPKWRVRLLGGVTVFCFLSWYNCGMLLWEKGLRPLLLLGFVLSAVLFYRLVRRSRRGVQKRHITCWRGHLLINLVPAWFVGFLPAGIFQSAWVSGAEHTESLLIRFFCGGLVVVLIVGFLLLNAEASGKNWGYDPEEEKKKKRYGPSTLPCTTPSRMGFGRRNWKTSAITADSTVWMILIWTTSNTKRGRVYEKIS